MLHEKIQVTFKYLKIDQLRVEDRNPARHTKTNFRMWCLMRVHAFELKKIANRLRVDILNMITQAGNGHPGGSLSVVDLILELYLNEMRHNANNPRWPERDRLVLSKGHGVPALYAVLAYCGYFPRESLMTLRQLASPLQGHPANRLLDCIEASTGSLGQGLSVALGMALAARLHQHKARFKVYAILGDGELQEGQVWEAAMGAAHYRVDNLVAIVDRNQGQIDGLVNDVMKIEPLADKFKSFGWRVQTINGHDYQAIHDAIEATHSMSERPHLIIANTIKGKGVSFLESDTVAWHGKALSQEELAQATKELMES